MVERTHCKISNLRLALWLSTCSLTVLGAFEDVAVNFMWEHWQDLDSALRLCGAVVLEGYSSLLACEHCITRPEAIFKLEKGTELGC